MPTWLNIVIVIAFLWIGIGSLIFIVNECGAKGLFFGNGAMLVAASGVCGN